MVAAKQKGKPRGSTESSIARAQRVGEHACAHFVSAYAYASRIAHRALPAQAPGGGQRHAAISRDSLEHVVPVLVDVLVGEIVADGQASVLPLRRLHGTQLEQELLLRVDDVLFEL